MRAFVMAIALTLLSACTFAAVSDSTQDRIIYRPVGQWRGVPPECGHPYTLTVYGSGRVVYNGRNCVREMGMREMNVDEALARAWIERLIRVFDASYKGAPYISEGEWYELELVTKERSQVVRFARGHIDSEDVARLMREIEQHIDPKNRWVCFGYQPDCKPPR